MSAKLLLAAALAAASVPPNAQSPLSDLEKYIAWRGGAAFEGMLSVNETGEARQGRLHGPFRMWFTREEQFRRTGTLGPLKVDDGVTTHSAWTANISGQIEDMGDKGEGLRDRVALSFANTLEHTASHVLLGQERREGRDWDVIRLGFGGADTYDLFIDPGTGELLGIRMTEDGDTRFVRYRDWRMVSGVRMAFAEHTSNLNKADDEDLTANAIAINLAAPAGTFTRPASRKTWHFSGGGNSTGWIDFEFFRGNEIYIPARLNDVPVSLLLDSGAGITVIDSVFAKEAGIHSVGELRVSGAGGRASFQLAKHFQIALGNLTFDRLTAGVTDLAAIRAAVGHPMRLILGREAFNGLVIDIDFARHRIAFHDSSRFSPPLHAVRVPLGHHRDKRTVELSIEGRRPQSFDFDLGNDSPLIIYSSYRNSEHLLEGRPHSLDLVGGVGGFHKVGIATLSSLTIAHIPIRNVPTEFPDAGNDSLTYKETAGNVGLPIFTRFRLITDYPDECLWLMPDRASMERPFNKDRSGLIAQADADRLKVLLVAPGSPAARDGWKEGEQIIAVDGIKVGRRFEDSAAAHWSSKPAGTDVELQLANGSTRKLTLADYY
jgi:Aspartyl protease